jgi:hypothetical protein
VKLGAVEINAFMVAMLEIPPELTQEYNRWYDLDHIAEHISKGDVLAGRRYVATRELRRVPGIQPSEWTAGYPPYVTTYLFGGPLDFVSDEAQALWTDMDRGILKAGRFWRDGRSVHGSRWRVADAVARPSCLVSKPAIPYLAHRGIIIALGKAPSAERMQEAVDWWDNTHLVDLFAVPGVLAAIRGAPEAPTPADTLCHILLCEDSPADVMVRIDEAMRYQRAIGRFPAHGGVYESIAFLPYDRIVPLEYDFDVSTDEEPTDG